MEKINLFFKKAEWFIDVYFVWMLYNPQKYDRYIEYLEKKWGNKNEQ